VNRFGARAGLTRVSPVASVINADQRGGCEDPRADGEERERPQEASELRAQVVRHRWFDPAGTLTVGAMRRSDRYDLVVIGGGTAGLVSALIAAGAGARVALVERERTGGDCLWTGCVPSKALIAAAELAHRVRHADRVGLAAAEPEIDFARVMERVDGARRAIEPQDSPERLRSEGVEVIGAAARFVRPGTVEAGGRELRYRTAIVATGSRPAVPPVPGLSDADPLTTATLWDLRVRPERLLVVGGGAVGCELGQAFARLGSKVTLVEMAPRLLAREEPAASALVARALSEDGVEVLTDTKLVSVGDGRSAVLERADGAQLERGFNRVLVAVGRLPVTDGIGLETIGAVTADNGALVVDSRLRTSVRGVYGAGDVTGALPFTHVAAYHARVAVPNALFHLRRSVDYAGVPWATFTDPEVARVGLSEQDARERWGARAVVAQFDYAELDRAITAGEPRGFAMLIGDPRGRLVGATVVAAAAGETIAELAAHVAAGAKVDAISQQVHAYPTFSEGPARAADDYLRAKLLGPRTRALVKPLLALLRTLDRPSTS
jgi:pyruvate/2-oxoglutarate dehydrogenase complex dihydrolipoamide dehydrogenase (E3) component